MEHTFRRHRIEAHSQISTWGASEAAMWLSQEEGHITRRTMSASPQEHTCHRQMPQQGHGLA